MIPKSARYSRYFTYIQPVLRAPIFRTYGPIIASILTTTILIIFAIKPTLETIAVLQKDLENHKEILAKLIKKEENLAQGKSNYQKIDPTLRVKIKTNVPEDAKLGGLIQGLEGAALGTQASISALQFQPLVIEKTLKPSVELKITEILFTYNVEGSYDSLKQVLQNLKTNTRLITVDKLTLNKIEGASILMSVTGKAYYIK